MRIKKHILCPHYSVIMILVFYTLNDVHSKIDKDLILQDFKGHVQTRITKNMINHANVSIFSH